MTLLDANVLIYAYNADLPQHAATARWLTQQFRQKETLGLPWISLWAFVRICTNVRVQPKPLSLSQAFEVAGEILRMPRAELIQPGAQHGEILKRIATNGQAHGPRFTDAVLAALAVEHGAKLASTDRDFSRFAEVQWVNPLV